MFLLNVEGSYSYFLMLKVLTFTFLMLKVIVFTFGCSIFLLLVLDVESYCSCSWKLKVFFFSWMLKVFAFGC
jgi:hypothetical protein